MWHGLRMKGMRHSRVSVIFRANLGRDFEENGGLCEFNEREI